MGRRFAVWLGLAVIALGMMIALSGSISTSTEGAVSSSTELNGAAMEVTSTGVGAPSNLRATAWQGQVNLTWDPSSTADIDGYTITTGREGVTFTISDPTVLSYSYNYPGWDSTTVETANVTAYRGAEVSAPSNTVQVRVADEHAPTITITSPSTDPGYFSSSVTLSWVGTDNPPGVAFYKVYYNGMYDHTQFSTSLITALAPFPQGNITVKVEAYDLAGLSSNDTITLVKDTIPPVLVVSSPAEGQIVLASPVQFWFNATDVNFDRYQYSLDGFYYTNCAGNNVSIALPEGNHSVWIRAWDLAGNAAVVKRTVQVDLADPMVELSYSGTVYTNDTGTLLIEWTGSDSGAGIANYSLIYGATVVYNGTGTSFSVDLSVEGTHWVEVRAYDLAGRQGIDYFILNVDRTPPVVSFTSPSDHAILSSTQVSPTWNGGDGYGIASYEVSLNGGAFVNVGLATTKSLDLVEGANVIIVRAVDLAGNQAEARLDVVADTTLPECWFVSPANGTVVSTDQVSWSGSDGTTTVAEYRMSLNGIDWFPLGTATSSTLGLPADGSYTVRLRAVDSAGHVSETVYLTIVLDKTSPVVEIEEPASTLLTTDELVMSWSVVEQNIDHYEVWVDSEMPVLCSSTSYAFTGLTDGTHVLHVRAVDKAGNTGTDSLTITVDTTDPAVAFLSPQDGSHIRLMTISLSWTASDASGIDHFTLAIDGGTPMTMASNVNQYSLPGLAGEHTATLTAYDGAGRSASATVHVTIDIISPEIEILTPGPGLAGKRVNVTWSASDDHGLDEFMLRVDGGSWQEAVNGTVLVLTGGEHVIEVKAIDLAGNNVTDSVTITVDATAPEVTAHSPTGDEVPKDAIIHASFSEAMDVASVTVTIPGVTGTLNWNGNTVAFTPLSEIVEGKSCYVYVNGTDLAGNAVNYSWMFKVVSSSEEPGESNGNVSARIVDEDGQPISGALVSLDNGTAVLTAITDSDGFFSMVVPAGNYTVTVSKSGYNDLVEAVEVTADDGSSDPPTVVMTRAGSIGTDLTLPIIGAAAALLIIGAVLVARKRLGRKP